jgi:hypothetical protein
MRKVILGIVMGVAGLLVPAAGSAKAFEMPYVPYSYDYHNYNYRSYEHYTLKKVVTYETVVTYEIRRVPYQADYTLYDYYGRPYTVSRTLYREIKVPVKTLVPVVKFIRVYE